MLAEAEGRLWGKPQEPLFASLKRAGEHVWQTIKRGERGEFATEKFVRVLLFYIENRVVKTMIPELPVGFEDAFKEQMRDKKTIPIFISSHRNHADLITVAAVSKILTNLANQVRDPQGNDPENRFPGFALLIAASIRAGKQGTFLQQALTQTEERYLPKYPLTLVDCVRPKDMVAYRMKPNTIAYMRKLKEDIEKKYGIAVFPEESVEGGRRPMEGRNDNEIKGLQAINCDHLDTIMQTVRHIGYNGVLIPAVSRGTNRIVDSNLDKKTKTPANRIALKGLVALLEASVGRNPINAKLGMPITYDTMAKELGDQGKESTPENRAIFLGRKMAELLPPNERGVYA